MFPRLPSALAGASLAVALLSGCTTPPAEPGLAPLTLQPDRVAVAGLSSGAYMATQVHLAFSDRLAGAALIAGGPYGCAQGTLEQALGPCMKATPAAPDAAALADAARARAADGRIAPLSGLSGDRVLVLHGADDATVAEAVTAASAALYTALDAGVQVDLRLRQPYGHVMPTLDAGVDCKAGGAPHIGRCGVDVAGEAMQALFGQAARAPADAASGTLRRFDQTAFRGADGADALLDDTGLLYVPPQCDAGQACGLLVAFHGCEQAIGSVQETFARDAGFNRWADVLDVAVLYPQARASFAPLNPKACWDWWGYSGAAYDTRDGLQLQWLARATAALGAPLN